MKSKMKYIVINIFIFLFTAGVHAQQLSPCLISTSGTHVKSNRVNLSYSIGEVFVPSLKKSNKILTQGFQQANRILRNKTKENNVTFDIRVYPNPAAEYLYVDMVSEEVYVCYVKIIDIAGRTKDMILPENKIGGGNKLIINVSSLSKGQYYVRIIPKNKNRNLLSFSFIKQ